MADVQAQRRHRSDDEPDLLVTASIFAGLLSFFAALVVVFLVTVEDSTGQGMGIAEDEGERLYFGEYKEIVLVQRDRVDFADVEGTPFAVATQEVSGHPRIAAFMEQLSADQRAVSSFSDDYRTPLFAIQPGAAYNWFWLEAMAGDANVQSVAYTWFHPDCEHIDERGKTGSELYAECVERGR